MEAINLPLIEKIKKTTLRALQKVKLAQSQRIYLIIGDEGAILTHVENQSIVVRLFANSLQSAEVDKFKHVLAENPWVPTYVLIDIMDQNYQPYSLPPVSALSINSLVEKRLERDFPSAKMLRGGYFLSKTEAGRKDWLYLFASCPLSENITTWLNFLYEAPNPLNGIQFFPLEMVNIINHPAIKALYPIVEDDDRWEILLTHHKVSGFRQVAFKNHKMVITRLIATTDERFPDVMAGNIEQEIQNTIEFLRRLASKEIKAFNIIIVVAQEIGEHIDPKRLAPHNITVFNPFSLANKLSLINAATAKDKFCETIIAAALSAKKPILTLHTVYSNVLQKLFWGLRSIKFLSYISAPLLMLLLIGDAWDIFSENQGIDDLVLSNHQAQQAYSNLEKKYNLRGNEVEKMQAMISLYRLLTANQQTPFDTIQKFISAAAGTSLTTRFSWKMDSEDDLNSPAIIKGLQPPFRSEFNILFKNSGSGFEALFKNFGTFIQRLEKQFKGYDLRYSHPADQITFGEQSDTTNIVININSLSPGTGKAPS